MPQRKQQEYAQALEDQISHRSLKEKTRDGGHFTLGQNDDRIADERNKRRATYAEELEQQVREQKERKKEERERQRASYDGADPPSPVQPEPSQEGGVGPRLGEEGFFNPHLPVGGGRRTTAITRPDQTPEIVAARQQQQNEMQAALAEQVAAKNAE